MINPFKMLGDVNAMRKQAAAIQAALKEVTVEGRDGMNRVSMTGNQDVIDVEVNGVRDDSMKRAIQDAIKRSQQVAATKLQEISKDMQ